ncbi:MAG: Folylpolyglutamate synthase [Opitutia bacterium UBA7350]|nr:MAG: Folylpolyglutamate synthase [Opitutae bacterium UBA7350]
MKEASDLKAPPTSFAEACTYLYALRDQGSKYGLERIEALVRALKNPHHRYPVIHVAGTNGKGSVCAMLEALYRANGYRTGLFTSPHLMHLGERIQVNRQTLKESSILEYTQRMQSLGDPSKPTPSFFEYITAMAWLHFAKLEVDLAIIETGLGGRLDATNVILPELSIITSISLDHCDLLGDTLADIACEKGGIIKPDKPVLLGCLPPEAEKELRRIATEQGSKLYCVRERFPDGASLPVTNLKGQFQRWNAALAVYATEILQAEFPIQQINALQSVDWPGRWQRIQLSDRELILDATHNPEGASALEQNLRELKTPPVIIAGTLGEDRGRNLIQTIAPFARELILVEPSQPRATPATSLHAYLPSDFKNPVCTDSLTSLFPKPHTCTAGRPHDIILVTGSIYLIGEVLTRLQADAPAKLNFKLQDRI